MNHLDKPHNQIDIFYVYNTFRRNANIWLLRANIHSVQGLGSLLDDASINLFEHNHYFNTQHHISI